MYNYQALLAKIINRGVVKSDRTGTGTMSIFGHQMRFDLDEGFPLVTSKKTNFKAVMHELLWFINGDTNIKYLNDHGVHIWDEWADENGDLGPIYGVQWRDFVSFNGGIDQLTEVIESIKNNPDSRRHIVTAWNPVELPDESVSPQQNVQNGRMALAPCHTMFQFYVANGKLSLQLYQRSADCFLGVPFNIASYALLLMMVAQVTNLKCGEFVYTLGDAHLYLNHLRQVDEIFRREPKKLPKVLLNPKVKSIFDFKESDITLKDYSYHPHIRAPIAV